MRSRGFLTSIAAGLLAVGTLTLAVNVNATTTAIAASTAPVALPAAAQASADDAAAFNSAADKIFGTPVQRRLAEEYVNNQLDAAIRACMATHGYSYDVTPFVGIEVSTSFGDSDLAAPLGDFHQAKLVENKGRLIEGSNASFAKATDKTAYLAASTECGRAKSASGVDRPEFKAALANARPTDRLAFQGNKAAADRLSTAPIEFQNAISLLQQSDVAKTLLAGYQVCLAQHGFAATSWLDLYAKVAAKYKGLLGKPWSEINGTQQWADATEYERTASIADTTCRGSLRSWAVASMRKTIDSILADTRTTELADGWAAIASDAQRADLN